MAITLTNVDFQDLRDQAKRQGEQICQPIENGTQYNLPQQLGQGGECILQLLRQEFKICIRQGRLRHTLRHVRKHESNVSLVAKFYLSGTSRIQTLDAIDIDPDYREMTGYHYLYHLPNHTEIEEWPAERDIHVVMIFLDPDFFSEFEQEHSGLPKPLQALLAGHGTQRFHQSLGPMSDFVRQQILHILHCPYTGLMHQLYLESKVLELLTAQFTVWQNTPCKVAALCTQEIEQLHWAKDILVQQVQQPPSLKELALQVGLGERKLNQGFRELFGTTVFGYLQQYRMQQAQVLLHNRNTTVAKVAATVGYRNPEAFGTAFRRQFAVSPKAYQLGQRA